MNRIKKRIKRVEYILTFVVITTMLNLVLNMVQQSSITWLHGMYENAIEVLIVSNK